MYALFSETLDTQERKFMGGLWYSLPEVENCVNQLMDLGTWPYRTTAIAINLSDNMATYSYSSELSKWSRENRTS